MGWKSIELQVAIPRSQDAGKMQEQMLKQNENFQTSLAQTQLQQEELKRKRVMGSKDLQQLKWKQQQDQKRLNASIQAKDEEKERERKEWRHPYLGKRVDFNG
ncbi:MAG: hypothetical protein ACQEWU_03810 [Bacillota bacterium]|uniref:Uncharacterized protein n=1 Tax=Virgibacillus salarius TaxID=447199 RepID=A0A941DSS7_9BACI|nr:MULTISPECIES: hypothetical protein [Bacillaceae]NAZ07562.1 hypothetical protein [Agaribacter marinus]MBR7794842.1 hypothetical protein [Virgibacillus salarius]MCC2249255.1 hypothetical protein [Virgibacillus sp. AGTR]MDY7043919.1 hypothetical protein [Virgibacillus sp. M23]QRZ17291.1 hypothetical protein JUJ52_16150 [Virgibacillus sp. AGTR]